MARVGISEQQVIEAAEQLAQSGQAVTVSAVREVIGSGSFSTINGHLAKWRESGDARKPADVPDMPDPVGRAVRQLWTAAWKEAQDGIKTEREGLDAARREMERERRDMANEITRLETENGAQAEALTRLSGQLAEQTTARNDAEKANNELKIDNARLDERAKAAEGRAGELRSELDKLHGRFQELAAARPKTEPVPRGGKKQEPQ
jgi:hypothetical protein